MAPSVPETGSQISTPEHPLLRLGIVSDIQYADLDDRHSATGKMRYYRGALSSLERAITDWNSQNVNCVLHLGDIIDCRNTYSNKSEFALYCVLQKIEKLNVPLKHVIGNHCVYCFGQSALLEKLKVDEECGYYSFQLSLSWKVIVLNTSEISLFSWPPDHPFTKQAGQIMREKHPRGDQSDPDGLVGLERRFVSYNGGISQQQLDWFTQELESATQNSQKVIVLTHIPINPEFVKPECLVWNYDEILEVIGGFQGVVQAVISGHTHHWSYGLDSLGIHYFVVPGMVEQPPEVPGHGILEIYENVISLSGFGWQKPFLMELS